MNNKKIAGKPRAASATVLTGISTGAPAQAAGITANVTINASDKSGKSSNEGIQLINTETQKY